MSSENRKNEIVWEENDTDFDFETKSTSEEDSQKEFEALLNNSGFDNTRIVTGEKTQGTISVINSDNNDVLVELSSRHSGVIDKIQLLDEFGDLKYKVGDSIEAYVVSRSGGAIVLSMTLEQSKQAMVDLEIAFNNQVPVKGKVLKDNKGGFEVSVLGKEAFCPVSQIDTSYVENKSAFVGQELQFLIEKFDRKGKNLVVSRAKLLRQEAAKRLKELEENLNPDTTLDGKVKEIRDYGAFIDIGGIDGFLHISEISYAKLSHPRDFLEVNEKVRVKVLSIEEKDGKKRISLSMKAIESDPWTTVTDSFETQKSYTGKVTRLTKFGAFVELMPGIEGLIHLSEMSWHKRIYDPSEVVKEGDMVKVRILDINQEAQKLSLSLKDVEEDPWFDIHTRYPEGKTVKGKVDKLKGFGAIIEIAPGLTGLVPLGTLKAAFKDNYRKQASPPKELEVTIQKIDEEEKKILLSLPSIQSDDDDQDYKEYVGKLQEEKSKPSTTKQGTFGAILAAKLKNKEK